MISTFGNVLLSGLGGLPQLMVSGAMLSRARETP